MYSDLSGLTPIENRLKNIQIYKENVIGGKVCTENNSLRGTDRQYLKRSRLTSDNILRPDRFDRK